MVIWFFKEFLTWIWVWYAVCYRGLHRDRMSVPSPPVPTPFRFRPNPSPADLFVGRSWPEVSYFDSKTNAPVIQLFHPLNSSGAMCCTGHIWHAMIQHHPPNHGKMLPSLRALQGCWMTGSGAQIDYQSHAAVFWRRWPMAFSRTVQPRPGCRPTVFQNTWTLCYFFQC